MSYKEKESNVDTSELFYKNEKDKMYIGRYSIMEDIFFLYIRDVHSIPSYLAGPQGKLLIK